MNTCKTCFFWGKLKTLSSVEGAALELDESAAGLRLKPCAAPCITERTDYDSTPDNGANSPGDLGDGQFCTGPDFGCVLHKPY